MTQKEGNHLEQDINARIKIKQHQNIGLVKCGLIHQYLKF
jgi:hypothetical protein